MSELDGNQESSEETTVESEGDRPLSQTEDIELDIRESMQEIEVEEKPEGGEPVEAEQPTTEEAKPQQEGTEDKPQPPAGWSAEEKEWFNKQPVEAQRIHAKRAAQTEARMHQATQEAAGIRKEYSDIDQAIKPYENEWRMKGIDRAQGIQFLAAASKKLEEDFTGGMALLAQQNGTSLRQLADAEEMGEPNGHQATAPQQPQSADPRLQELSQTVNYLMNEIQSGKQSQADQAAEARRQAFQSVRDETDSAGRYLRPELHDESFVNGQMVPMLNSLHMQFPGEKPNDLLRRAYTAITQKAPESLVQPTQTPNANRAGLSVRGKPIGTPKPQEDFDPNASVEDDIKAAMREHGWLS